MVCCYGSDIFMTNQEKILLLQKRIKTLWNELDENPQYTDSMVNSIQEDINYYQNQIEAINDEN